MRTANVAAAHVVAGVAPSLQDAVYELAGNGIKVLIGACAGAVNADKWLHNTVVNPHKMVA